MFMKWIFIAAGVVGGIAGIVSGVRQSHAERKRRQEMETVLRQERDRQRYYDGR